MRQSYTAVVAKNVVWKGDFATEPYEAAWASEAIFYVRILDHDGLSPGAEARVQISPDGIRWCDEGTRLPISAEEVTFARVRHFGEFLRIAGTLPAGAEAKVLVTLSLKE